MKKKFKVATLGCRTNQYETQGYVAQLRSMGWEAASDQEEADLCVVNTCTVTQSADSSSRHQVRKLAKENPNARIVVTGCAVESHPEDFQAIEGVDQVFPNESKETLLQELFPEEQMKEFAIEEFDGHTRAFVKVQDGCNSYCTYCVIPYVRGRSRSRKVDSILKEVEDLVSKGTKEIVLTGINIGDFDGGGEGISLASLVRQVDAISGVERLRLSSIDPDEVDDELLDAIIEGRSTCPSMHIVLQSGSNVILKKMNRKYTRQMFFDSINRLKNADPDFTFTTDLIVGFPGETQRDFEETLDAIEQVQFAKVHMFPYSDRPRTRAALYKNKIPNETIRYRKHKLLQVAERQAFALREEYIGRTMKILTESPDREDPSLIRGHTENFLPVVLERGDLQSNEIIEVELSENHPDAFLAKQVCYAY